MTVTHIVGARPNFMKAAPVLAAIDARGIGQRLVHTGQHYDRNMSEVFFDELGIPKPDVNLGVGSGSHAAQTAETMIQLEGEFMAHHPDLVVVYGDINSTVAATLVAAKLGIPIAHVEAGLRSRDRRMPEEVNRLITDQLAALLFTPSVDGNENLVREGVDPEKVHLVGNVMIDTLVRLRPKAEATWDALAEAYGLAEGAYILATLHRPSTVDNARVLERVLETMGRLGTRAPVLFPVHPRTRQRIADMGLSIPSGITLIDPVGYLDFLSLQAHAQLVVTDSGGIQEETTYLGVPCLTVRENTERPVTVTVGTNQLVGFDMDLLERLATRVLDGESVSGGQPLLWEGRAGERIASIVEAWLRERADLPDAERA
ncbi:MAG: UDP-N-acetylglucosamine 2-epimerase (non-hydrolyzing) [Rubricoccaceae bacterium]